MQRPEDVDRGDCAKRQLRRNVVGDAGQSQNLDVKCLSGGLNRFQILAAVTSKPQLKLMASDGLLDRIVMAVKLVANGCSDKVRTIGVEPLLHEEVDMTEVDVAEVDRDLLAIAWPWSKLTYVVDHLCHPAAILMDGIWRYRTQLQAAIATFAAKRLRRQRGLRSGAASARRRDSHPVKSGPRLAERSLSDLLGREMGVLTIVEAHKRTEALPVGQMLEPLRAVEYELPSFDEEPRDVELSDTARPRVVEIRHVRGASDATYLCASIR